MTTLGTGPHGPAGPHPGPTHPGPSHPPEPAPRPRFAHPTEPQPGQPVDPRIPDAPAPQPFVGSGLMLTSGAAGLLVWVAR